MVIGREVEIAANAAIGPYVVLGPGCVVEAGARVRDSVLWETVRVEANAQVDRSILAAGVVVPAHDVVVDAMQILTSPREP